MLTFNQMYINKLKERNALNNKICELQVNIFRDSHPKILVLGLGESGCKIVTQIFETTPLSGISYCTLHYKKRDIIPSQDNIVCICPKHPLSGTYWDYNKNNRCWNIFSISGPSFNDMLKYKIKNLIILTSPSENKIKQWLFYICEACLLYSVRAIIIEIKQETFQENSHFEENSKYNLESLYKGLTNDLYTKLFTKIDFNLEPNYPNIKDFILSHIEEICKNLLEEDSYISD